MDKKCLFCKKKFKPKRNTSGLYCSNQCQINLRKEEKVKEWLKTGVCHPGTKRTHYVRDYLYSAQNNKCSICKMKNIWNKKEINFILDHIDGDSTNNNRENLRLVCPNCDSQLPTYKSKNNGKGRHTRRQRYAEDKSY